MLVKEEIILSNHSLGGDALTVRFLPLSGMNFTSFKKNDKEIIDQTTLDLFEERFAGLGAMIGPHFHHRQKIPPVRHEALFPHIAKVKAKGVEEPFSHGIARYAPWRVEKQTGNTLLARLSGSDNWNHVSLAELEGAEFEMTYEATLLPDGLHINLDATSDKPCVVGLHTYYSAPRGGEVIAEVQNLMNDQGTLSPLPWALDERQRMTYAIDKPIDFGFYPFPDPKRGKITLKTPSHTVRVSYESPNDQNCFQIWHPLGKTFVCIEPISAKIPAHPVLRETSIKIHIEVV